MKPFLGGDAKLAAEVARHLALWMAYEDIIRVADLKTRASRFERVRKEVGAKSGEPVVVIDYLKPGVEEFASVLPHFLGKKLIAWAEQRGKLDAYNVGMHIRTSGVFGYLLVRSLAWLRPWRPMSYRYREEQQLIERWLAPCRRGGARATPALALEIAECARLIKGYGETHRRGKANFLAILDALVENPATADAREQAAAIRKAREAALADPEGQALGKTARQARRLAEARKIRWFLEGPMASVPQPNIACRAAGPVPAASRSTTSRRSGRCYHSLIPNEPVTPCKPALWKYRDARPYLMEAGKLITAKEATRRVLILQNPGMPRRVLRHAKPVRRAAAHPAGRGCAEPPPLAVGAALRRRGRGRLHRGRRRAHHDAPRRLHHHAVVDLARPRQSRARTRWSGSTASTCASCSCSPRSSTRCYPEDMQPVSRSEGASLARFGNGLAPVDAVAPYGKTSPIFSYPYERSRESLAKIAKDQDPDPCHGWKLEFINPLTGGHAMPTIATFLQLLPKGFRSQPYRSTDGTVYCGRRGRQAAPVSPARASTSSRATSSSRRRGCRSNSKRRAKRCCSRSPTAPGRKRWGCGEKNEDERAGQVVAQPAVQQPRAGPRASAVPRALGRVLGARAQHHDLLPRPRLRRAAGRERRHLPRAQGRRQLHDVHPRRLLARARQEGFLASSRRPGSTPACRSRW